MIVCLGWGSLIWLPGALKIKNDWLNNGPAVAVEYLRQSNDGRLTLVIDKDGHRKPVLWAEMDFQNCEAAKENLRIREKTSGKYIGLWQQGNRPPTDIPEMNTWATSIGAQAVIWTDLPPKFGSDNFRKPSLKEAQQYLQELDYEKRILAKEYIRNTPLQIQTPFRAPLERTLAGLI
jgi:hypothetical protein